jgi:hypothetical protein
MKKVGAVNLKERHEDEGKVRVFCRFRPMNQKESKLGSGEIPFKIEQDKTIAIKKVLILLFRAKLGLRLMLSSAMTRYSRKKSLKRRSLI